MYISTRGAAPTLSFEEALLGGLASDGGLYVPSAWPRLSPTDQHRLVGAPFAEVATEIVGRFVDDGPLADALPGLVNTAYRSFDHTAVAPLVQVSPTIWLMELFHGPTLAFKDVALQLLGQLFDAALARRGERMTVIGATSGDTGSAAIEACQGLDRVDTFILYPKGRTSEVQRRQMTTVEGENVHAIAIEGDFDDCQEIVKALFADAAARAELSLGAVNSINWARIAAQTVYYVTAALALGAPERAVAFAVPTGNFGNVFAGWVARRMGVPISCLGVASNANDILTRFFESGRMQRQPVVATLSPAMDIQISSNFERLLFELNDRSAAHTLASMEALRATGGFAADDHALAEAATVFAAGRVDDAGILAEIARTHGETGLLIDPHSAVGLTLARRMAAAGTIDPTTPIVALACAHPAKFPDAVKQATGRHPELPARMADLFDRPERSHELPADAGAVLRYLRQHARIARVGA